MARNHVCAVCRAAGTVAEVSVPDPGDKPDGPSDHRAGVYRISTPGYDVQVVLCERHVLLLVAPITTAAIHLPGGTAPGALKFGYMPVTGRAEPESKRARPR